MKTALALALLALAAPSVAEDEVRKTDPPIAAAERVLAGVDVLTTPPHALKGLLGNPASTSGTECLPNQESFASFFSTWEVGGETARALLWMLHVLGWLVAVAGFQAGGAAHLFGLAQARASAAGRPYVEPPLVTSGLYAWIRHPLYAGTLVALWSVPTMTSGRLLLAATLTAYIAIGARLEEGDLARRYGGGYRAYRARVPGYVPSGSRDGASPSESD